jgi:cold shock CspA family protein
MRTQGTLVKWNQDRGFGFIRTCDDSIEIFAHISAFPRSGRQPQIGDPVSFDIVTAADGRKQAKSVIYDAPLGRADFTLAPTEKKPAQPNRTAKPMQTRISVPRDDRNRRRGARETSGGILRNLIAIALLLSLGWLGYRKYQDLRATETASTRSAVTAGTRSAAPAAPSYHCDGRTRCAQMRSCADATRVLEHCPGTEMDGDGDGIPCETQWCN